MNLFWRNRSNLLVAAESVSWYALLFSLPFQRRVIVYHGTWYFQEWLSFALYGTDILFLLLCAASLALRGNAVWRSQIRRYEYFLAAFLLAGGLSVFFSSAKAVSLFGILRLLEFVIFYWYVSRCALARFSAVRSALAFAAGVFVQSLVAIGQSVFQHDLGLRWLGESVLGPQMQNVASFYLAGGEKVMRAYGTTPHPNVLAAFLLTGLIIAYALFLLRPVSRVRLTGFLAPYGIFLWALLVTFSRTIIALWAIVVLVGIFALWRRRGHRSREIAILVAATFVFAAALSFVYWPEVVSRLTIAEQEEAVQLRIYYSGQALGSGAHTINWFGVGIGNFVGWLMRHQPNLSAYLYQPVHNIYLLIYAEVGIVGLILWLAFIAGLILRFLPLRIVPNEHWPVVAVLVAVLAMGLLDHFPWTLQQGRFLMWGALAAASFCAALRDKI